MAFLTVQSDLQIKAVGKWDHGISSHQLELDKNQINNNKKIKPKQTKKQSRCCSDTGEGQGAMLTSSSGHPYVWFLLGLQPRNLLFSLCHPTAASRGKEHMQILPRSKHQPLGGSACSTVQHSKCERTTGTEEAVGGNTNTAGSSEKAYLKGTGSKLSLRNDGKRKRVVPQTG